MAYELKTFAVPQRTQVRTYLITFMRILPVNKVCAVFFAEHGGLAPILVKNTKEAEARSKRPAENKPVSLIWNMKGEGLI